MKRSSVEIISPFSVSIKDLTGVSDVQVNRSVIR